MWLHVYFDAATLALSLKLEYECRTFTCNKVFLRCHYPL